MAEEKRVKDFPTLQGTIANDDYIPVDGATNGTRKMTVTDIANGTVSGLDTDATSMRGAINELKANAFGTIALTQQEYNDLPDTKLTDGIAYYIIDGIPDVDNSLWTKVGTATLNTTSQNCSGAINELKSNLANKLDKSSVKDNLTSTSTTDALSAKQGKVLNDSILRYKDYNVTIDTTIWQGVYTADADISSMISQGYKPVSATVYYIINNRPGYAYIIQTESKVRLCTTSADVKGTSATVRVVFTKAASL